MQSGQYPSPGCVSMCNDLKFPFFDTESVYIQKQVFQNRLLVDKRRGNRIQIKIFLFETSVCKSLTAFAMKRGTRQHIMTSERKRERKK